MCPVRSVTYVSGRSHLRDLPIFRTLSAISDMRFWRRHMRLVLLVGALALGCFAQTPVSQKVRAQTTGGDTAGPRMMPTTAASTQPGAESQISGKKSPVHSRRSKAPATLTEDDGLSVIAAALDSRTHIGRQNDCSH